VLEAWYPGSGGGEAIARLLFGEADPSGRLPETFPASEAQLPRPELPGAKPTGSGLLAGPDNAPITAAYDEGSDVGYRWFHKTAAKPLFPFGWGLAYTQFRYGGLKVAGGDTVKVSFTVTNTGARAGTETAQAYLLAEPGRAQQRLIGWKRVTLKPHETRTVSITAPARMLASWSGDGWRVAGGDYQVAVGPNAEDTALSGATAVKAARLAP
jgi:beta-glucosidase